jgi:hypothetical protein
MALILNPGPALTKKEPFVAVDQLASVIQSVR